MSAAEHAEEEATVVQLHEAAWTVVLVGMRGAGKSTLGARAASLLGVPFSDMDEALALAQGGKRPAELVEERGWEGFRQLEAEALAAALAAEGRTRLLSCGGGIVDTPAGEALVTGHWPVVFIDRHIEDLAESVDRAVAAGERLAPKGETTRETHARRYTKYRGCADFSFPVARGDTDTEFLARALARLLLHVLGYSTVHLGPDTLLVSLTAPSYTELSAEQLGDLATGADALELRVDLLASLDHGYIAQQMAQIRRHTHGAPVLYSVRSAAQGGNFAGGEGEYLELLRLGLALGAELLDLECTQSQEVIDEIVSYRGSTFLVGSYHDLHGMPSKEELSALFQRCALLGHAAVARVVVAGTSREESWRVQEAGDAAVQVPFIGVCTGGEGRLSQLLNLAMCPVAHASMPPGLPGQLTGQELLQCRRSLGLLSPVRQFPIIGPWGDALLRLVPAVHASAFKELGAADTCPGQAAAAEGEVRRLLSLASVGGAMLLGATREVALSLVDEARGPCREIRAVDCVVREKDGRLAGHSTESGALAARLRKLGLGDGAGRGRRTALVLGGGPPGRAARATARELGFGRVLCSPCAEPEKSGSFAVTLDKRGGEKLGVDVSHDHGDSLRVELVTGGLVEAWNAAHAERPELCVRPGDMIVEVNGQRGEVSVLVGQLASDQVLALRLARPEDMAIAEEPVDDFALLAGLPELDVLVLAEPPAGGYSSFRGSQWLLPTIVRLRPVVVEMCWPSSDPAHSEPLGKPCLFQGAKAAECVIIEAPELLLEQVCACLALWTAGSDLRRARRRAASALVRELSKEGSPRGPTNLLVNEANVALP